MKTSKSIISLFIGLFSLVMTNAAHAVPVGLAPVLWASYPDYSQIYADNTFAPLAGHSSWWGDPTNPATCNMCGPTTASDAMSWLAGLQPATSGFKKLTQVKVGGVWSNATPGVITEQMASKIGAYETWNPNTQPFPGTTADSNYINGQKDFFTARGLVGIFDYVHVSTSTYTDFFNAIVNALVKKYAIELSNLVSPGGGHWFAVAGARTDQFNDANGNGVFDAGDTWINDYNNNGVFDRYLYINNPWPNHASQGWDVYSQSGADWLLAGDTRPLDSVVFVHVPEPGTIALIIIGLIGFVTVRLAGGAPGAASAIH